MVYSGADRLSSFANDSRTMFNRIFSTVFSVMTWNSGELYQKIEITCNNNC